MKAVAEAEQLDINDDPRPRDRVLWNRLRLILEADLADKAWGCCLYRLHREGRISNDEREAGDRYFKVVEDHRKLQDTDPDDAPEHARDLAYRRVNKAKAKYEDARALIGFGTRILDPLIFDEVWPSCEKEHLIAKQCLNILATFFNTGLRTKGVRKGG
jgi:hypothetical protein